MTYVLSGLGYVANKNAGIVGLGATGFVGRALVPTKLLDGDQLDTSDTTHSLAKLYNTTAQEIVKANGVSFSPAAIEGDGGWVEKTGGKLLTFADKATGKTVRRWVFSSNSVILLPAGGPRPPAGVLGPTPKKNVKEAGVNPLLAVAGAAALGFLLFSERKKRATSSTKRLTA